MLDSPTEPSEPNFIAGAVSTVSLPTFESPFVPITRFPLPTWLYVRKIHVQIRTTSLSLVFSVTREEGKIGKSVEKIRQGFNERQRRFGWPTKLMPSPPTPSSEDERLGAAMMFSMP